MAKRPAKYEVELKKGAKVLTIGGKYHVPKWKELSLSPNEYVVIAGKLRGGLEPDTRNVLIEIRGKINRRKFEARVKDLIPLTEHARKKLMGLLE